MTDTAEVTVNYVETGNNLRPFRIFAPAATMLEICKDLGSAGATATRTTLAKELERSYPGANPETDRDTIVAVSVKKSDYAAIQETIARIGIGLEPAPEGFEEALPEPATPVRPAKSKAPKQCACGCGGMTGGGTYLPGHDMKLRSSLIKRVDKEGDTQAAAQLVEHEWWTQAVADERIGKYRTRLTAGAKGSSPEEDSPPEDDSELDLPGEDG